MSIAAFYKDELVFTRSYGWYEDGHFKDHWATYEYTKGNIQPWKAGEGISKDSGSGFYFSDYNIIYLKDIPTLVSPVVPPADAEVTLGEILVWFDNAWYTVSGNQNWRRNRTGPIHRKLQVARLPNLTPAEKIPPTPDTSLRTVEAMDNETYELEQVVDTLTKSI